MKQVLGQFHAPAGHWVGDGFPVRTLFSYDRLGKYISPWLLLDYAGPQHFDAATQPRGVGPHPHRGFETVTLLYSGEVTHRDSAGNGGTIGVGEVQWMTAGSGLLHEEMHSQTFTQAGGLFEAVQLWINLPARHKSVPPGYQSITRAQIPEIALPGGAGTLRLVAGEHVTPDGTVHRGPARSFTPTWMMDVQLKAGHRLELPVPAGWNCVVPLLRGRASVGGPEPLGPADLAILSAAEAGLAIEALEDSVLLVLAGEPIDEPIAGYGPFVMNTRAEIEQAYKDFQGGAFGRM
ncbi:MAG: hypothetical protein RL026_1912 [Pseudomonadota bacterium]|jgi:redox-sensitive bicupin YhaK (pirin superfamily)